MPFALEVERVPVVVGERDTLLKPDREIRVGDEEASESDNSVGVLLGVLERVGALEASGGDENSSPDLVLCKCMYMMSDRDKAKSEEDARGSPGTPPPCPHSRCFPRRDRSRRGGTVRSIFST